MSDSMRPHRRQPTRLPRPWDSPGKNTGVGCHFLLQCMKVKSESEVAQSCPTFSDPMDCSPPGSSVHGIFQARVLEWGSIAFSMRFLLRCIKFNIQASSVQMDYSSQWAHQLKTGSPPVLSLMVNDWHLRLSHSCQRPGSWLASPSFLTSSTYHY